MTKADWKHFKLEQIASVERGKFTARPRNDPQYYGGSIPFVQTGDVANANGIITTYSQTLNQDGLKVSRLFPKGSILITIAANIGEVAMTSFDVACPDSIVVVQAHSNICQVWLKYALSSQKQKLETYATQNAQKNINLQVLRPLKILTPPLEEQKKIAEILSTWDKAIALTEKLIAAKQKLKKGLTKKILSGKLRLKQFQSNHLSTEKLGYSDTNEHSILKQKYLGELPKHWKSERLKNLASKITDGSHSTPQYIDSGIPFLRVTDIQTQDIDLSKVKYISIEEHEQLTKRCKPEINDILLSKNGTIGIAKVITWDWEFSTFVSLALIKIADKNLIMPYFLKEVIESSVIKKQIYAQSKQGTVTNLHLEEINKFLIPYPPIKEQKYIVQVLSEINQEIIKTQLQLKKLKKQKRGLMQKLLTGEWRVNTEKEVVGR